jgi:hypothetical protein
MSKGIAPPQGPREQGLSPEECIVSSEDAAWLSVIRMPVPPRPLPPELGRVFTPTRAREHAVSPGRLRARDLGAPFSGVRVVAEREVAVIDTQPGARDRAERARVLALIEAYKPLMSPGAFLAGRTAVVWFGAVVEHGDALDIGVVDPDRAPRRRGIRGRKVAEHLVRLRVERDLRLASPASAWAMLASEMSVRDLVRLGDQLVRVPRDQHGRRHPELQLATIEQLHGAQDAGRRPGAARLREALSLIRVGSMSPLETDARCEIVHAGLPEPELDAEIRSADGTLVGIADAAYREHRLLLEVEGDHHRTDAAQWARDLAKHAAYAAEGWSLVRLAGAHIRGHHPPVAAMVRAALLRAGARL